MNRGPAAGVRWWAQKRRSLFWLAASLAGAWAGCRASLPPWSWALAGGACLAGLIGGRRRGHRAWYALLLAALAASTALSASLSAAEYAWRERHYPRGERRLLEARIVDVVPHSGGRLALAGGRPLLCRLRRRLPAPTGSGSSVSPAGCWRCSSLSPLPRRCRHVAGEGVPLFAPGKPGRVRRPGVGDAPRDVATAYLEAAGSERGPEKRDRARSPVRRSASTTHWRSAAPGAAWRGGGAAGWPGARPPTAARSPSRCSWATRT